MTRSTAILALALAACTGQQRTGTLDIVLADSAGVEIVTVGGLAIDDVPSWTLDTEPAAEIGTADGTAGHDLHWPRAASRLPDGGIILANMGSNEVREFESSGRFVRALGRKGAGPGEFQSLAWTGWLEGDTILGYDPSNRRLTVFAPDGSVARTATLELPNTSSFPEMIDVLANGRLLAYPGFDRQFGRGERRDTIAYMLYSRDGGRPDTLGLYAGPERFFAAVGDGAMMREVLFGRNAYAAARGTTVVLGSSDALALDLYGDDGALRRRIRVTLPPLPVSRSEAAAQRDALTTGVPDQIRAEYREAVQQVPQRETHPAFTGLLLDDMNSIWVRLPAHKGEPETWLVLSSSGAPIGRVTTDAGLEIEEAGSDYVIMRSTDADGVQRFRLHSLNRR